MKISDSLLNLGLTQYEITAYLGLVGKHPVNGSQLSRKTGIPRARIYDVLHSLRDKGLVVDLDGGQYAPLPPKELIKRLRSAFETDISNLEDRIKKSAAPESYEYVWTIRGYEEVMAKARAMIEAAETEVFVRLFPREGRMLSDELNRAAARGVQIKYISMGGRQPEFDIMVVHPDAESMEDKLGGRSFDLVADRQELLVGLFESGNENDSPINWAKNHWFVVAARDSLRHDFFHYFLYKTYDLKEELTEKEKEIYEMISGDY